MNVENMIDVAAPVVEMATASATNFVHEIPGWMSNLRSNANYGYQQGVHDLARFGVIAGGVVVIAGTAYGVCKCSSFLSDKSSQLARKMRNRASGWRFHKEDVKPAAPTEAPAAAAA